VNRYKFWYSSAGWKSLWVALRRSIRDPRARRNLVRLLFSLLLVTVYPIWYLHFLFHDGLFRGMSLSFGQTGNLILGIIAVFIVGFVLWNVIRGRMEKRALERNSPAVAPETKVALHREACLLATLLERLGSEIGMEKELPENIEVITRRVLLDRLAELNLRDDLEPALRDILLTPDGHWPQELKNRAYPAWECFSALRWILGLGDLAGLTANPNYKLADAHAMCAVKDPQNLSVRPAWDIRPARDSAYMFFYRCWSELTARRLLNGPSDEDVQRALNARESIQAEGYTKDYLIGSKTVPEWPDALLWQAAMRANHRMRALSLLVDITSGEKPPTELRGFIASYFIVHVEEPEAEEVASTHES
jgi:hypothetical protein